MRVNSSRKKKEKCIKKKRKSKKIKSTNPKLEKKKTVQSVRSNVRTP